MLRKLLLGAGLVLELAGVILALIIMTAIEYLLSGIGLLSIGLMFRCSSILLLANFSDGFYFQRHFFLW
jgi:hypothetical protein